MLPVWRLWENRPMRLSIQQRDIIKQAAQSCFGPEVVVRLFGSRLDDHRKGGDIDLLIETQLTDPNKIVAAHHQFMARIYTQLGEQKVDVLIDYPNSTHQPPIFQIARTEGAVL